MAIEQLPDLGALGVELEELERREPEISASRARLHERLAVFPSEFGQRQERAVSTERQAIHKRINELRAQLRPFRQHH